jgi:hypothetical protein
VKGINGVVVALDEERTISFYGLHADTILGPRYRIDALRVPAAERREGRGERERREDHIYQEPCWERQQISAVTQWCKQTS